MTINLLTCSFGKSQQISIKQHSTILSKRKAKTTKPKMKYFALFCIVLVVLGAMFSSADANEYKKPLEIKHVWTKHGYGYGHGHDYGKKLVGHSQRYQHMKHSKLIDSYAKPTLLIFFLFVKIINITRNN